MLVTIMKLIMIYLNFDRVVLGLDLCLRILLVTESIMFTYIDIGGGRVEGGGHVYGSKRHVVTCGTAVMDAMGWGLTILVDTASCL